MAQKKKSANMFDAKKLKPSSPGPGKKSRVAVTGVNIKLHTSKILNTGCSTIKQTERERKRERNLDVVRTTVRIDSPSGENQGERLGSRLQRGETKMKTMMRIAQT